ncbi:hypothetical protein KAI87_04530 [Myxococcota bacterium]|nr:hypothetical protein [Myxococcota bacterium]
MFVEGEVEIKVKDRAALAFEDHEMKIWLQRAFKDMSCYRVSDFSREGGKMIHAVVAIKTDALPTNERTLIETRPNDVGALRSFIEKMFEGKGVCRALGDPKLKSN